MNRFQLPAFVLALLLLMVATGCLFVDRYVLDVHVRDARTGEPIREAAVLATFRGDKARVPLPHLRMHNSICITSIFGRTNASGHSRLSAWQLHGLLANQLASITVVKPGWHTETQSTRAADGMIGFDEPLSIGMIIAPSEVAPSKSVSVRYQSVSRGMTLEHFCGRDSWRYGVALLEHLRDISVTDEEHELTLGFCKYLSTTVRAALRSSSTSLELPHRCDSSLFRGANVNTTSSDEFAVHDDL